MHVSTIIFGIAGILTLIFQIVYLVEDYTFITIKNRKKTYLIPNFIGIIGSLVLIGLSVINLIII